MAELLLSVLVFSILAEAITNIVKSIYKSGEGVQIPVIVSIIVSVLMTVSFGINLLTPLGFATTIPFVAEVLTGIIISRGSNFVSDILYRLQNPAKNEEQE